MKPITGKATLNPTTPAHALEFGGHLLTPVITVLTPLTAYFLYFGCSEATGCPPALSTWWSSLANGEWSFADLFDTRAFIAYYTWYAFSVVCWALLPGEQVQGTLLRDGTRKSYKINAFSTLLLTLGLVSGRIITAGPESFTFIYDHFLGLITASLSMAILQALYVYVDSYRGDQESRIMALAGNSGHFFYDFWMGRELNPSIGSFDIKTFNELRPGLILWLLVDISCACEQYCRLGGRLSMSMFLTVAFHAFYVVDALFMESAIFTQMDIVVDGFGFMLSIGDLTWVPFTYSLQARYLAFHPTELSPLAVGAIFGVQAIGYYIFRTANEEKNQFRLGNNPKNLTAMETKRGTKLLTSGWWGRSRHPNYLGDWLMAWAWSLPCGFETPIPYFYVAYFAILLVHRQIRDDEACKEKYGDDWDKYCKLVPYKIIPYVY